MKKKLVLFFVAIWEIICVYNMIINIGRYSVGDYIVVFVMAAIPLYIAYLIIIKKKETKPKKEIKSREKVMIEELAEGLPVLSVPSLILMDDQLHYYEPATLLTSQNKVVGHTGGSSGVSVRVAKGVYLRSGSSKGRVVYGDVTTSFDGRLAVTDKRIIFINSQKGFDVKIKDISVIEPYNDGIGIQVKTKSYILLLDTPGYFIELFNMVLNQ